MGRKAVIAYPLLHFSLFLKNNLKLCSLYSIQIFHYLRLVMKTRQAINSTLKKLSDAGEAMALNIDHILFEFLQESAAEDNLSRGKRVFFGCQ